jgi:SAM-dependent methyltransferase
MSPPTDALVALANDHVECPSCRPGRGTWAMANSSNDISPDFFIQCEMCQLAVPIRGGVIDFSSSVKLSSGETLNSDIYSAYWEQASEEYNDETYADELSIIESYREHIVGACVLDAGCGDGRHLASLIAQGASKIVCIDISEGIFLARKRLHALNQDFPALFLLGSISELPLRPKSVDVTWSSGTLTLIKNQETALEEIARVTRHTILLGVTSNQLLGRIYSALNLVRPLCRSLHRHSLLAPPMWILAWLLLAYCRSMTRLNLPPIPFSKEAALRIGNDSGGVSKLQTLISEPFVSPNVDRQSNDWYRRVFKANDFVLVEDKSEFLIDYFVCTPNTSDRK